MPIQESSLLIIHYNHPYYESAGFLIELYGGIFPNIIFYGDGEGDLVNENGITIHRIPNKFGYFFTRVMTDVFEKYPSFDGYYFLQDDCILNYWNYTGLDSEKIWFALHFNNDNSCNFYSSFDFYRNRENSNWIWWSTSEGAEATKCAMNLLKSEQLEQLVQNIGSNMAVGTVCDMFYIPGKFQKASLELCKIYKDVFCEIAVPMILCSLDTIQNWECLKMEWRIVGSSPVKYPSDCHWVHPIKLSDIKNRVLIQNIFNLYDEQNNRPI